MAALRGDQILREEIQGEIAQPVAQQLRVRKARFVQPPQRKAGIIDPLFFHMYKPPEIILPQLQYADATTLPAIRIADRQPGVLFMAGCGEIFLKRS